MPDDDRQPPGPHEPRTLPPPYASHPPPPPPYPPTAPVRVVVADDNPVVRAGLTALLQGRADLSVVAEAADGRQAYEAVVRLRPDVVLLDVRMPGVDGISALPHLVPLAPVLMLTYSRESEIVHEALRLGAGGYLVHGEFTAEQLIDAVRDIRAGRAPLSHSATGALLAGVRGDPAARRDGGPLPDGLGRAPRGPAHSCASPAKTSATAHIGAAAVTENRFIGQAMPGTWPYAERGEFARQASLTQANVGHSSSGAESAEGPHGVITELSRREVEVMELIASGLTNQQIAASCFISPKTVKNHINRIFAKLNAASRGEAIAVWHGLARGGAGPL
ncbi:response regulator [Streptomyces sp. NPDC014894]|uniref:response regulator transcription factor n=1 Tax=Streptomyces sp. NPDC014894 TaxID=3364931 RepID=UPI0037028BF6